MKIKYTKYNLLSFFLLLMPIIDTLSGFTSKHIIGQLYRLCFFSFLLIGIFEITSSMIILFLTWAVGLLCMQFAVGGQYAIENIQQTIKLLTPMVIIILASEKSSFIKNIDIKKIINGWSVLYPATILIPYVLGMQVSSYDGSLGVKGFYYATNEISFVLCTVVIIKFVDFAEGMKVFDLGVLGANVLCIALLGTKSGYMTLAILLLSYILKITLEKRKTKKIIMRRLFYVFLALVAICLVWNIFESEILGLIERWRWLRVHSSNSAMDFLTSNRIRRIGRGFGIWINTRWWFPFFGWGFAGETVGFVNCEMDIVDLLFRTGLYGFVGVFAIYSLIIYRKIKWEFWNSIILMLALIMIFFAGHILFYGASGMALGVLIMYCMKRTKEGAGNNDRISGIYTHIQ